MGGDHVQPTFRADWRVSNGSGPHLCLLSNQYSNIRSGIGIYARNVIGRWLAEGWRVTVVVPVEGTTPNLPAGARILTVAPPKINNAARWLPLARRFAEVTRHLLYEDPPDAILCTDARECRYLPEDGPPIIGLINDNYAAVVPWHPFAYIGHYPDWLLRWGYYQYTRVQEAIAYRKLAAAICNSHFVARSIRRAYSIPEDRMHVVHKSVDATVMALPDPPVRERGLILTVGGNAARKGVPALIDALPAVRDSIPGARLEVIGESGNVAGLTARARRLGVAETVAFRGRLPHEAVIRAHHRATVFAMPALIEAFGLVYLEAAICGTPVIGTTNGGVAEIFPKPGAALLVDPGDRDALVAALVRVLGDPTCAARLATNGQKAAARFTVERMMAETVPIIISAIQRARTY